MYIRDIIINQDDHLPLEKFREMDYLAVNEYLLPKTQLARALAFGTEIYTIDNPDVFVDAYLGFSQRLPLSASIQESVDKGNQNSCPKISLDIPTGFNKTSGETVFKPDMILTLGAMKSELIKLTGKTEFYLADLGLPAIVYENFHISYPSEFKLGGLFHCKFNMG